MKKLSQLVTQHWLILLILILGLSLRLPLLNGSFWLDEAAQALESARPFSQQLQIRDDFQPPLLHLLVHFELLISRSEWFLRLGAALIPGLLTILVSYKIAEKTVGKKTGLLAALLLATSSFHIFYSQELRPYAMPAFFASLSWLILIEMLDKKNTSWRKTFFYFAVSLAGLFTSYLYPFLFMTQILYVLVFQRRVLKHVLLAAVGTTVCYIPWMPSFLDQLHAGQSLRQDLPGWQEVVSFNQVKSIALIFGKFSFGVLDLEFNAFFGIVGLILIGGLIYLSLPYLTKLRTKQLQPLIMMLCWLILPIFLAWIVSFFVPVLQPKRVLYSLPAFYLILSWFICEGLPSKIRSIRTVSLLLAVAIIFTNLYSTASYLTMPKYQREDWRGMHELIIRKYPGPLSAVAFAFPAPFAPWQWYDNGKYPTYSTGVLTTATAAGLLESKQLTQYRFVLVFDYLRDLTDPEDKLLSQLQQYGYREVDHLTPVTPLGFVRVYAKSTDVIGLLR